MISRIVSFSVLQRWLVLFVTAALAYFPDGSEFLAHGVVHGSSLNLMKISQTKNE